MMPVQYLKMLVADSPALRSALVSVKGHYARSPEYVETGAAFDEYYQDVNTGWAVMNSFADAGRYGALAEWIRRLAPRGAVLDIGAGNGLLAEALASHDVDYLGVDIAAQTVAAVQARLGRPNRRFVVGDATSYVPEHHYPLIIFNDMLYYLEQPVYHVQRLCAFLEPGGTIIVAMYLHWPQIRLLHDLCSAFDVVEQTFIHNSAGRSFVHAALKPRAQLAVTR